MIPYLSAPTNFVGWDTMAKKKKSDKSILHGIEKSAVRDEMKRDGAFDGRFRAKVVPGKKRYRRKPKNDKGNDHQ